MVLGDATAGRGYQDPGATNGKPSGNVPFDVPRGDNPYFSTPAPTPQAAGSEQDTAANGPDASDLGQPEVVTAPANEPTFDIDTDRANGIDVNDPSYKHFQAAFTRRRQSDKTDLEKQLEAMQARLDAADAKKTLEDKPAEQQAPTTQDVVKLAFDNFVVPRLPETAQLHGLEEEIAEIFKPLAQAVINDVARQQQAAFQRMQAEQTKAQITNFVSEIERAHPDKVGAVLQELEEYPQVAKANPEKWIKYVKKSLGLDEQETRPALEPSAQRLVQKQQNAVQRPTTGNGSTALRSRPQSTREAIEAAFDAHWRQ
jgi:hypothetical protein